MKVVSNSSPLINLAGVGGLDWLKQLYGQVIIPQAVYHEITVAGAGQPGAIEIANQPWIETKVVINQPQVRSLMFELDLGEAEAIVLAIEYQADILLIDERKGRHMAMSLGLNVTGVLGILVEAKTKGLVTAVKPILDALRYDMGFRYHQTLYHRILQAVGE